MLIYLFAKPTERVVEQRVPAVQSLVVGGLDIGKQVTDSISSLRTTLGGITDAASAQAALPKLQEVTTQIDKVDGMIGQLSAEQRKSPLWQLRFGCSSLTCVTRAIGEIAIEGEQQLVEPGVSEQG